MRVMIYARDAEGRAHRTYHEVEPRWEPADRIADQVDETRAIAAIDRVVVSTNGLTYAFGSESVEEIMREHRRR